MLNCGIWWLLSQGVLPVLNLLWYKHKIYAYVSPLIAVNNFRIFVSKCVLLDLKTNHGRIYLDTASTKFL